MFIVYFLIPRIPRLFQQSFDPTSVHDHFAVRVFLLTEALSFDCFSPSACRYMLDNTVVFSVSLGIIKLAKLSCTVITIVVRSNGARAALQ